MPKIKTKDYINLNKFNLFYLTVVSLILLSTIFITIWSVTSHLFVVPL